MSNPVLSNLQKTLQIGTSRGGRALPQDLPDALRDSLFITADLPEEVALWTGAAAVDLWTRAGHRLPATNNAGALAPCAAEILAPCPQTAETSLSLLLQNAYPQLRAEWLLLANRKQCRLPLRFLPAMLDLGARQRDLRTAIGHALGERGRWLARQNLNWRWAIGDSDSASVTALWETGSLEQRAEALQQLRAADAAGAREQLSAVWRSEAPDHRATLLGCLSVGLDAADEPFIEAALDDKRKEVRLAAQALLAALPGSALSQRMLARLAPLLTLLRESSNHGKMRLEIVLPTSCDRAMQRDGIGNSSHTGLGEKAGWLADMLAAVPPAHWSSCWDIAPDALLALAADNEFHHALLLGWSSAAHRTARQQEGVGATGCSPTMHGLSAWLNSLTQVWLHQQASRKFFDTYFFRAFASLPPALGHMAIRQLIGADPAAAWTDTDTPAIEVLQQIADASGSDGWPQDLSLALVNRIRASIATMPVRHWTLQYALPVFARIVDPALLASYQQGWPPAEGLTEQWQKPIADFLSLIHFRNAMHLSFQEHAS